MRRTRSTWLQGLASAWRASRCVLLAACLPWALAAATPAPDGVLLRDALAVSGQADAFRSEAAASRLTLPAHGAAIVLGGADGVWLRLRFDRPAGMSATTLLAAHMAVSCGWMDVELNGHAIHRDAVDPAEATSTCPRPRLFALPASLLRDTGNWLDIHLRGPRPEQVSSVRRAAGLSAVSIGPHATLVEAQAGATFWHVTSLRVIDVVLLMSGGFMLLLALATRRNTHLVWFGLTALSWAATLAPVWWSALPLTSPQLEGLLAGLLAPTAACAVLFLMSFVALPLSRTVSIALLLQCALLPLSLSLAPRDSMLALSTVWGVALSVQMLAALAVYLHLSWQRRRSDAWTMLAIVSLAGAAWALDVAQRPDGLPWQTALAWALASPYGWSVLLIALGIRLMVLFSQTLIAAEASRLSLESQVRDITAKIEHNFAQLSEMRVAQVTEQERKRIAADLHDDLGAKLLTIVHTCDNERIATLGREALDEMRLSVRGLSGRPMRLGDAMADWRAETVLRLGQTNIQVEWHNPGEEIGHILPARAFVQTTRILREAVSNIIKHSGASRCQVTCFTGDGEYGLVVQDNGRGIATAFDGGLDRGHGLASMKHRAKQLQGQCLVESGVDAGTVIRLTLPL